MTPILYVLLGFILGQASVLLACYIGELINEGKK